MAENEAYDPTAPEDDPSRGSNYLSKKDFRNIVIGIAAFMILLYPLYQIMAKTSEKARCVQNMKEIAGALNQYAAEHDDRFPPLFATGPSGAPAMGANNLPFTWVSDISGFTTERSSFFCPSAQPDEAAKVERITQGPVVKGETGEDRRMLSTTYGFYSPYSGYLRSIIEDPNGTIVVAETSNRGAHDTYDPLPYKNEQGEVLPFDGFAIGWDNDNFEPDALTKFVTRLAFPETSGGNFDKEGPTRHSNGINSLNASGGLIYLTPNSARVRQSGGQITGLWATPPIRAR